MDDEGRVSQQLDADLMLGKTEAPLISVVIAIYNVEKYLGDCLNSVVGQTYKNLDIILVDDGSTDSSGSLCDSTSLQDNRVRVLHKKNGGLSDARNAGVSMANGRYTVFIDGDDFVSTRYIEKLAEPLILDGCDLSACGADEVSGPSKFNFSAGSKANYRVFTTDEALAEVLLGRSFTVSACGKLTETRIWEEHPFPIGKVYEDFSVVPGVFHDCRKLAKVDAAMYGQRIRKGSITRSKTIRPSQYADYYDSLLRNEGLFGTYELPGVRDAFMVREQIECARIVRLYSSVEPSDEKSKEVYESALMRLRVNKKTSLWRSVATKDRVSIRLTRRSPRVSRLIFSLFQMAKAWRGV